MMPPRGPLRRLLVVFVAIACSSILLRTQVASALVIRGDDVAVTGDHLHAAALYRRAWLLDADDGDAVDRYAFITMLSHRRDAVASGIVIADAYLRRHPHDLVVRTDRALSLHILRRFAEAERDFAMVAYAARDARALTFAGFEAYHRGARARALRYWSDACNWRPVFEPACRARRRSA